MRNANWEHRRSASDHVFGSSHACPEKQPGDGGLCDDDEMGVGGTPQTHTSVRLLSIHGGFAAVRGSSRRLVVRVSREVTSRCSIPPPAFDPVLATRPIGFAPRPTRSWSWITTTTAGSSSRQSNALSVTGGCQIHRLLPEPRFDDTDG